MGLTPRQIFKVSSKVNNIISRGIQIPLTHTIKLSQGLKVSDNNMLKYVKLFFWTSSII